jgi:hypothetical protein
MEWNWEQFKERLGLALQQKGLCKKDLSAYLKKSHSVVSGWGTKHSRPSLPQIVRAAEFLCCGPAWLAFGIGPQSGFGAQDEHHLLLLSLLTPRERECICSLMTLIIMRAVSPVPIPDQATIERILKNSACANSDLIARGVPRSDVQIEVSKKETSVAVPDIDPLRQDSRPARANAP